MIAQQIKAHSCFFDYTAIIMPKHYSEKSSGAIFITNSNYSYVRSVFAFCSRRKQETGSVSAN